MTNPLLSVIKPNYNDSVFIEESLESIRNQSFQCFEIIIIDDGSTDNSVEIINEYKNKCPYLNIRLFCNKKNLGTIKSINKAIKVARGKYLFFHAMDDLIFPEFFYNTINFLQNNTSVAFCVTDPIFFVDNKPYEFSQQFLLKQNKNKSFVPDETVNLLIKTKFWFPSHSSIFKKEIIEKYGPFKDEIQWFTDWYLNIKIAFEEPIGYIPNSFAALRIRKNSFSGKRKGQLNVFRSLMNNIYEENSEIRQKFKKSGVLLQCGTLFLLYIVVCPRYWTFLPSLIRKKVRNILGKIFQVKTKSI